MGGELEHRAPPGGGTKGHPSPGCAHEEEEEEEAQSCIWPATRRCCGFLQSPGHGHVRAARVLDVHGPADAGGSACSGVAVLALSPTCQELW